MVVVVKATSRLLYQQKGIRYTFYVMLGGYRSRGRVPSRLLLKCDGTRAETRFRLSAKRTSPFKSSGTSVQWTTGSRSVCISGSNGSNAGYTMFRGGVEGTGYPLHSLFSPSLPLPCVTVCHHVSPGLYLKTSLTYTSHLLCTV